MTSVTFIVYQNTGFSEPCLIFIILQSIGEFLDISNGMTTRHGYNLFTLFDSFVFLCYHEMLTSTIPSIAYGYLGTDGRYVVTYTIYIYCTL